MQTFKITSYETIYSYNKETVYWTPEDSKAVARITRERKRDEYIDRRNNAQSKRWRTK